MTRAILLDLGKVIVHFDFSIGYRAFEERRGLPATEIRERIRATGLVPRFETGLIEPRAFVRQLCEAIGLEIGYDDFCDIWSSIFSRETILPESLIESLASHYPLVLVSNTNALHFGMVRENYNIIRHFHTLVLSYEVGAMKPSPAIYDAAVRAAGCAPEECFFTDDIAEYVEGARQFGIDAVQFQDLAHFRRELAIRNIHV